MPVDSQAPTGPLSGARGQRSSAFSWVSLGQEVREEAPEWRYPRSVETAEGMLNRAQVWSLFSATVLPIEGYRFWLDPNGNDEARTGLLAEDLGLPVGEPTDDGVQRTSQPGEFDFGDLLHEALMALVYGHYFFEWSGEVRDGVWRIDGIAPLHPATITTIKTNRQGWLEWVSQRGAASFGVSSSGDMFGQDAPRITPQMLIPFVYWPDARRKWTGRSMLRAIYQDYVANDVLARIDVTNHERAGGIPGMTTDDRYAGTDLSDLAKLASEVRIDENGGFATPPGVTPVMLRAGGTDIVGSMKYHDEAMARAWHSMVRQLGSTETGSRALGSTFNDLEALARRSIAEWVCRTVNQWVCARYWLWNFGERQAPVLRFSTGELEASSAPEDAGGVVPPDPQVAAASRSRSRPAPVAAAGVDRTLGVMRSRAPEGVRDLTDTEVTAAVDFQALDVAFSTVGDDLSRLFRETVLPEQLAAVEDAIVFTRADTPRQRITADAMAKIEVPVIGSDEIADRLMLAATEGAMQAHAELAAQGLQVELPTAEELRPAVNDHAKAIARLWARGTQLSVSQRAVRMSRAGLDAPGLAADVLAYSDGLTHDWELRQAQGAVQQALTTGRTTVWDLVPGEQAVRYVSSAVLDGNACGPCAADDGREFDTLAEATAVYPAGHYACKGGGACRCVMTAVLADEAPYR